MLNFLSDIIVKYNLVFASPEGNSIISHVLSILANLHNIDYLNRNNSILLWDSILTRLLTKDANKFITKKKNIP